jgi:hypothetical protein
MSNLPVKLVPNWLPAAGFVDDFILYRPVTAYFHKASSILNAVSSPVLANFPNPTIPANFPTAPFFDQNAVYCPSGHEPASHRAVM